MVGKANRNKNVVWSGKLGHEKSEEVWGGKKVREREERSEER